MVGGLLLGLAAVLAAVGLRDDMAHLPARVRFGVQVVVCAGGLIALGDLPATEFRIELAFCCDWGPQGEVFQTDSGCLTDVAVSGLSSNVPVIVRLPSRNSWPLT